MRKFVILTEKNWQKNMFHSLQQKLKETEWVLINKKEDLTYENLKEIKPEKIFIPHWSYIIPQSIFGNFDCIVFHMTDLPYGRGGSPLQNLIVNGHKKTKISALKVEEGIDSGPIYLKKPLSLLGTAQEIFLRSTGIVEEMILDIVKQNIKPISQTGNVVTFKRRKPEQSNLKEIENTEEIFDHIRMLDCEGYPQAFIETEYFRFEFSRASFKSEKEIIADVRIIKK